jgi:hypothetical protein
VAFRKLFESLASDNPLLVVVDDIHWAEPTLLDLIECVASFARDARLVVLRIARPDLFELRPAWAVPNPNAAVVTLEPLAGEETQTLVDQLRDVPDDTRNRIVDAAEAIRSSSSSSSPCTQRADTASSRSLPRSKRCSPRASTGSSRSSEW